MSTVHKIILDVRPGETRAAVIDGDGAPIQFAIERDYDVSHVDSVYLGRVAAVRDNLGAAFVDLGLGSDGYLNIKDTDRDAAETKITEGAAVLVRVTRDGSESKGPMLTTALDFAGARVVLTPGASGVGVSKRITDDDERERLRSILGVFSNDDIGLVARTNAEGASEDDLKAEAESLLDQWQEMADCIGNMSAPGVIRAAPGLGERMLRDFAGAETTEIVVDDADTLSELKKTFPAFVGLFQLVKPGAFVAADIEDDFDAALTPSVLLPGGGSLIISETPAMTTIDVNAGRGAAGNAERLALETNTEAARAIGRALRLRGIGGLVAIDFLRMKQDENKDRVLAALRKAFSGDPANPRVGQFSPFGLVDVVRRRDGASLWAMTFVPESQKTPETVALEALNAVRLKGGTSALIKVAPAVAGMFAGKLQMPLERLQERLGFDIRIEAVTSQDVEHFEISES